MDTNELKSLQEAWYQVQGVGNINENYDRSLIDSHPVDVTVTESEVLGIFERAMGNVFYGDIQELTTKETREGTKYLVRVKDAKSKSSYTRFATREKISSLRANPNIASVELTDYNTTKGMGGKRMSARVMGNPVHKGAPATSSAPSQVAPTAPQASMAPSTPRADRAPQSKPKTTDHRDADGSAREKKAFSLGKGA